MSKMIFFDHWCNTCGNDFEDLVRSTDPAPPCPKCKSSDTRRLVTGTHLDPKMGVSSHFPTMADRWARTHRKKARETREG